MKVTLNEIFLNKSLLAVEHSRIRSLKTNETRYKSSLFTQIKIFKE